MKLITIQKQVINKQRNQAKPFLKWAGGKKQLLSELEQSLPEQIKEDKIIEKYIEPFLGGGAFFFYLKRNYEVKKSYLLDINKELIIGYITIKNNPKELINELYEIQNIYYEKSNEGRKKFFYEIREGYNKQMYNFNFDNYNEEWVKRTSYLIFLNRTCFNGLFRQNSKGEFNVPFGRYKKPKICDKFNIYKVHHALKNSKIICGDFTKSEKYISENCVVYLDPPYRPIKQTSNFTDYSKGGFTEDDQIRLYQFYEKMNQRGTYLILSNSDPKNEKPDDNFFDELYKNYNIERVKATRMINSKPTGRGKIFELIITNNHFRR